jgi:hypothetical protein
MTSKGRALNKTHHHHHHLRIRETLKMLVFFENFGVDKINRKKTYDKRSTHTLQSVTAASTTKQLHG